MFFQNLPYDPEAPKYEYKDGILTLSGNCVPTEPDDSLRAIFVEIYEHVENHDLTIIFKFFAINSRTIKKFSRLITRLNEVKKNNKDRKLAFYWYYPSIDESIEELGEFYKNYNDSLARDGKYSKIKFKLKSYNYD